MRPVYTNRPAHARRWRRARGATLFEFAVAMIGMAILAGVLLDRVQHYQAEAEQVGVRYQVGSLRTALAGKVLALGIEGDPAALAALAGSNPVTLLRSVPPNYRGEFDHPDAASIPRGSWYFDRKQRILVYVFNRNKTFFEELPDRWSFRVELSRLPTNNAKPPGTPAVESGVALQQVDG